MLLSRRFGSGSWEVAVSAAVGLVGEVEVEIEVVQPSFVSGSATRVKPRFRSPAAGQD